MLRFASDQVPGAVASDAAGKLRFPPARPQAELRDEEGMREEVASRCEALAACHCSLASSAAPCGGLPHSPCHLVTVSPEGPTDASATPVHLHGRRHPAAGASALRRLD